jgi:hypothetical protein
MNRKIVIRKKPTYVAILAKKIFTPSLILRVIFEKLDFCCLIFEIWENAFSVFDAFLKIQMKNLPEPLFDPASGTR